MRVRITVVTHRGRVRDHNEDCAGWFGWALNGEVTQPLSVELDITEPTVVVVCDGMGGHADGEKASRMATILLTSPGVLGSSDEEDLTGLLQRTADEINDAAVADPSAAGMGCTVVGVVLYPNGGARVFNVGDSRCYQLDGQYLTQLSVDHRGSSGGLYQALGGGQRIVLQPDFFDCALPDGVGLLLCTDGLDDYAEFSAIEQRVLAGGPDLVAGLRDLALAGGGGDNVTVLQVAAVGQQAHG